MEGADFRFEGFLSFLFYLQLGKKKNSDAMKSSIQVILLFLLGLVAGLVIPTNQPRTQFTIADFYGREVSE